MADNEGNTNSVYIDNKKKGKVLILIGHLMAWPCLLISISASGKTGGEQVVSGMFFIAFIIGMLMIIVGKIINWFHN